MENSTNTTNIISALKPNDVFYYVTTRGIEKYTYVCVHPKAKNYHILITSTEDPIRLWVDTLVNILEQGLKTYDDAKVMHIEIMEKYLVTLKGRL